MTWFRKIASRKIPFRVSLIVISLVCCGCRESDDPIRDLNPFAKLVLGLYAPVLENESTPDSVKVLRLNQTTGGVDSIIILPHPMVQSALAGVQHPTANTYYLSHSASRDIGAWSADTASGTWKAVPGAPFPVNVGTEALAIDRAGKFLYSVNTFDSAVSAFTINPSTLALTEVAGSPFSCGEPSRSLVLEPRGKYLYVAGLESGMIAACAVNPSTGALSPVGRYPVGKNTWTVVCDSTGQFVYVPSYSTSSIIPFRINPATGQLTALPEVTLPANSGPMGATISPNGKFLYVVCQGRNEVRTFTIDPNSGALTDNNQPVEAVGSPIRIAITPNGRFLYCNDISSNKISGFEADSVTGALKIIDGTPFTIDGIDDSWGIMVLQVK